MVDDSYKEEFIRRVTKTVDVKKLVQEGKVYDYYTMRKALSRFLKREHEPTYKQTKLFIDYFNIDDTFSVWDVGWTKSRYKVVRNRLGRFVKWLVQ